MTTRHLLTRRLPIALAAAALTAALPSAGPATAAPAGGDSFSTLLGSCAPGDDLVGDFTIRETFGTTPRANLLHLRLRGTITRTGTGRVGKYAEVQLDRFGTDGSETYAGALSRLVVPGSGTVTAAGRAVVDEAGSSFTPGLAPIVEDDFLATVCTALA